MSKKCEKFQSLVVSAHFKDFILGHYKEGELLDKHLEECRECQELLENRSFEIQRIFTDVENSHFSKRFLYNTISFVYPYRKDLTKKIAYFKKFLAYLVEKDWPVPHSFEELDNLAKKETLIGDVAQQLAKELLALVDSNMIENLQEIRDPLVATSLEKLTKQEKKSWSKWMECMEDEELAVKENISNEINDFEFLPTPIEPKEYVMRSSINSYISPQSLHCQSCGATIELSKEQQETIEQEWKEEQEIGLDCFSCKKTNFLFPPGSIVKEVEDLLNEIKTLLKQASVNDKQNIQKLIEKNILSLL